MKGKIDNVSRKKGLHRGAFIYPAAADAAPRGRNRIKRLEKEMKEKEEENTRLRDQLLRQMAEFDNYRKRTEREFAGVISNANEALVKEILPVVDDLARSLNSNNDSGKSSELREGIRLIYEKFMKVLDGQGVRPIKAMGEPFDTGRHEALLQMEKPDTPPDVIIEEYERGYTMNDKVIRHAKVVVSK